MSIKEYHWGSITIDGKDYTQDVEVRWTGEVLDWWRGESHVVDVEDIKRALAQKPEVIVIGTGESGLVKVTDEAKKEIEARAIKLIADVTGEAVKTFNIINEESEGEEGEKTKVVGLFHLTC